MIGENENLSLFSQPSERMTNKQWQKYFADMKERVKQSLRGNADSDVFENAHKRNYGRYKLFIGDVLSSIRHGNMEYCFYACQIEDLLKYECDRLRTYYDQSGQFFNVWLSM